MLGIATPEPSGNIPSSLLKKAIYKEIYHQKHCPVKLLSEVSKEAAGLSTLDCGSQDSCDWVLGKLTEWWGPSERSIMEPEGNSFFALVSLMSFTDKA